MQYTFNPDTSAVSAETVAALTETSRELWAMLQKFNGVLCALNAGDDIEAGNLADDLLTEIDDSAKPYAYLKFPNEYPAWEALRSVRAVYTDHEEALRAAEAAEDNARRA